jgi:hypothetical protein
MISCVQDAANKENTLTELLKTRRANSPSVEEIKFFKICLIRICYYIALLRIKDFKEEKEDKIFDKCETKA